MGFEAEKSGRRVLYYWDRQGLVIRGGQRNRDGGCWDEREEGQSGAMAPQTSAFLPGIRWIKPMPTHPHTCRVLSTQCSSPVRTTSCLDSCKSTLTGLTRAVLPLAVHTPHCSQTSSAIRKSLPCYFCFTSFLSGGQNQNFLAWHIRPLCWPLQLYFLSHSRFQGYRPFSPCLTATKSFVALFVPLCLGPFCCPVLLRLKSLSHPSKAAQVPISVGGFWSSQFHRDSELHLYLCVWSTRTPLVRQHAVLFVHLSRPHFCDPWGQGLSWSQWYH